jgi:outer membrane receptor protein involved in Fe transport
VKALFCLLFSLVAVPVAAGPVSGRIVDPSDRPVAAAQVILVKAGVSSTSAATNAQGEFEVDTPNAGDFELRVAAPGFSTPPLRLTGAAEARDLGAIRLSVSAFSEAIVVSASQVETPLSHTPATVTVITRHELESKQLRSVADALRTVPGLTVAATGRTGSVTGVHPRGGESNFTLVLIDDVPVNGFGGEFDFAHLSTVDVERIEVVRGPQSALFGSNAIGAVVRIVTRRGGAPAAAASVEGGGFDTYRFGGTSSGSAGRFEWGLSGERLTSDGFNGHRSAAGLRIENDDYERAAGAVSIGWREGETRLRADVRHAENDRGVPGPFGTNPVGAFGEIDTVSRNADRRTTASASAAFAAPGGARATLLGAYHRLSSDFISPFGPSESGSRRLLGRAQLDFALREGLGLSAGAELQRERVESTFITGAQFQPIPIRRFVAGYFTEARLTRHDRLFVTAGLRLEHIRRDRIEESPDQFSPRPALETDSVVSLNPKLGIAWLARRGGNFTKVRTAAGTGIRPPSGFDLAFTDNPSLKPERSVSVEAGVEQGIGNGRALVDAVAFWNEYDDLIVAVGSFRESSRYRTDNISNARSRGLEVGVTARHRFDAGRPVDVLARVGYTWLSTRILAVDRSERTTPPFTVGDPLLRQPSHQFVADVTVRSGPLTAFASGGGRSRALDVEPTLGTFGGLFHSRAFHTWHAGAAWSLGRVEVFGRVENLFDREYEEALGFPALGRRATVGLRVATGR